jgi:hypothetical protein
MRSETWACQARRAGRLRRDARRALGRALTRYPAVADRAMRLSKKYRGRLAAGVLFRQTGGFEPLFRV